MQKMSYVKRSIITAACVALCVILPMAFHSIQNAGSILSPMHIPVLLCGLICGPAFGLLSGLVGPLLSSLFTGMPPMAYLPPMIIELAVYGLVAGLMISLIRTKKLYVDLYLCLVIAMIAGRIVAGIAMALIFVPGSYSMAVWTASYFITAWPGIVIQLALIPTIVFALMKARIIPERYSEKA
ncbi:MAG TPA: ECF transporter S component [Firmicutes bacterium]|jgi:LytS/YehU family sensor histidine kinase|nr:ECF transporter S component [Bacillota bacterium]HBE05379.1 ECF transporter S component [Bacillota bacterium]HBL48964.1 ECF transporter S component [Bacillota bacterium]HBL68741.1 ECF transporter S component [Bacillota bacterium]HBR24319.1 ECF transporter S component [Bacillota bacterium]